MPTQKNRNNSSQDDNDPDIALLDDGEPLSFGSDDSQIPDFFEDLGANGTNHDKSGDDEDDIIDMEWDEEEKWPTTNDITDYEAIEPRLNELKRSHTMNYDRREVTTDQLNDLQKKAHDMIVTACTQESPSKTDGGDGIGRLQLLLGSGGGNSVACDTAPM